MSKTGSEIEVGEIALLKEKQFYNEKVIARVEKGFALEVLKTVFTSPTNSLLQSLLVLRPFYYNLY